MRPFLSLALIAALPLTLAGCAARSPEAEEVVVYTSLDEPYARPVLEAFTRDTGVRVQPVYDTEANKSRGLAQRILAERGRPRADVFWSSEVMQMLSLRKAGVLQPYRPKSAEDIPARYRDPEGAWTGFAARFRVLVYYQPKVKTPPQSLLDLEEPAWRGATVMADPQFGTTMTEAAALFQRLGSDRARAHYRKRRENGVRIVDGNSVAAETVARGDALVGQTDTDDALIRIDQKRPLGMLFPDQKGIGALLIPNTAALIAGGPHRDQGERFLEYLLRPETELTLANLPSRQLPLHESLKEKLPEAVRPLAKVRAMEIDYSRLQERYDEVDAFLREVFAQ
jgi:iron(III) transport system substrate-binding protein